MKKNIRLLSVALCLAAPAWLAYGQSATPTVAPDTAQTTEEKEAAAALVPSSELDARLFYQLLLGELSLQGGDAASGFELLLDAARKTNSAALYQRATEIALQSRSGDAALQAAQAWTQAFPDSRDANRFVLQILVALNRVPDTINPLKRELASVPLSQRSPALAAIPALYARVGDKALAAALVQEALKTELNTPATAYTAWITIARLRMQAGALNGALEATESAIALPAPAGNEAAGKPDDTMLLALELMAPERPRAEALIQKYLQGNGPAQAPTRLSYARQLLVQQRYAEAGTQLAVVTQSKPDLPSAWLMQGLLQQEEKVSQAAQVSLERYLSLLKTPELKEQHQRGMTQAYLALSTLAQERKDDQAAKAWLDKIDDTSDLADVQFQRATLLARQGKPDEARQLLAQMPSRTPEELRAKVTAQSALLRELKEYQAAYDLLASALAANTEPSPPVAWLYAQAMLAEKLNRLDDMERQLRQVISINPDYHHAYNALGYAWADRNVRLVEARTLIQKALSYAPGDPFIQDSLGWVEFRLGNQSQALKIFEAAFKTRPDAEIAAHYGEVLWQAQQAARAQTVWREGLALDAKNETLLETLKRLNVKLAP